MKHVLYISIIATIVGSIFFPSCTDDFLEKPESSDVTIDTIFSRRLYAESFLWKTYASLVPHGFPFKNGNPTPLQEEEFSRSILASISDEGDNIRGATAGKYINPVGLWPVVTQKNQEDYFPYHFKGIREAYIFLENIDRVGDIPQEEKEQMKAEAKVLIALRYQEMMKRYGGVPIIRQSLSTSDNIKIPRASLSEMVDFIVELCDEAAPILPISYSERWRGRITRGVALATKSRVLLYAASPLYNTGETILSYSNPEFICYGDYSGERWKNAADAALSVIKWADDPQAGCSLIDTGDPFNDYGNATSLEDNKEVILAYKGMPVNSNVNNGNGFKDGIYIILSSRGLSIPFNFIPQFRKADGTDQIWDEEDMVKRPFAEYKTKMNELEPRFYQCAWIVGEAPRNFNLVKNWNFSIGENIGSSGVRGAACMVKFHHNYNNEDMKDWIVFRLAEFYLNFAEAANEYYGPKGVVPNTNMTALSALNVIRKRGGLNPLNIDDKDLLRKEIKRERTVELYAEGHRNFDLRRWKEAEVMGGPFYGLRFVQNAARNGYDFYYKIHYETRFWASNQYFYPFPQTEIDKGYLVQNPGY